MSLKRISAAFIALLAALSVTPGAGAGSLPVSRWLELASEGRLPAHCRAEHRVVAGFDEPARQAAADACGGLRPGAQMTAPLGCTLNFVFTDAPKTTLYMGTAGHCTNAVNERVSAAGVGSFGAVAFRVLSGTDDFSLIKVDASKVSLVDSTVCQWGGPTGVHSGALAAGSILREYGWGFATMASAETRARSQVATSQTGTAARWAGFGSGGDSGAPILTEDGKAYAVHTEGLTPFAGAVNEGGPLVTRVLSLLAAGGFNLTLVNG